LTYVLFIWTIVAQNAINNRLHYDWRATVEFGALKDSGALKLCEDAAKELKLEKDKYKCIKTME